MLGIQSIASYLPKGRVDNLEQADRFETDREFVEQKIGVSSLPRFEEQDSVVSASVAAFSNLCAKESIDLAEIECVVLCTQNPDKGGLPHNSALVHAELGLPEDCACFDIGLGCSGYVYGLSVIQSFMAANGMKKGLLFTCDPYSRILDPEDKNTCLLFGDAASVTLISETPRYTLASAKFSTKGAGSEALQKNGSQLEMNGRAVFNFALQDVPKQIRRVLENAELKAEDIDLFLLHQGSRFMLENTIKRAGIPLEKAPIRLSETGNTVSSSIPLLLEKELGKSPGTILMSGFGVGLSWATAIYTQVK
ncbi:ketoacyl-ACP synthase III [Marinobacter sp. 71-i]|uniref:Ketoacyl-ACP synthase III n=1 Tax=Marinobacter iranensis TaxID=2962607 RepID=A0ABT5Y5K9_9GAMM|nr:ketoacyl-ACP synthase III [Marinobacter iranensis]MDF0748953.1 ketoacyl-ACP synthase III [Marinobacter iranensis]